MKSLRILLAVNDKRIMALLRHILHSQGHIYNVAEWWYGESGDSHFQKALAYLHDSGGRVDLVIGDFFPCGSTDSTKLCIAPIVTRCREIKSRPKVFALRGKLSPENSLHWKREFGVDEVVPNPNEDVVSFEAILKEMIARHFGEVGEEAMR